LIQQLPFFGIIKRSHFGKQEKYELALKSYDKAVFYDRKRISGEKDSFQNVFFPKLFGCFEGFE
jgi:hypothetical protein